MKENMSFCLNWTNIFWLTHFKEHTIVKGRVKTTRLSCNYKAILNWCVVSQTFHRHNFRGLRWIIIKKIKGKTGKSAWKCFFFLLKKCHFKHLFSVYQIFPYFFLIINVQKDLRNNKSIKSGLIDGKIHLFPMVQTPTW